MPSCTKKIIIAAGGTGGHLFPAQALAKELIDVQIGIELLFAGANLSTNAYFEREQFRYRDIVSSAPFGGKAMRAALIIAKGICQSLKLMRQEKPDLIVGFGSFHTFPILCAAALKNIPFILFESNAIPGKVVRLFSKKAEVSGIYFPEAGSLLKGKVCEVHIPSGVKKKHTREEAYRYFDLNPEIPTLLVFGGSQGAKKINQLLFEVLPVLKCTNFQLLHFTGNEEVAAQSTQICKKLGIRCCVKKFEPEMQLAYTIADVALCRSGAITISELLHYEVPALLIPFPAASDEHQLKNAEYIVKINGATVFQESTVTLNALAQTLLSLLSHGSPIRLQMKKAIQDFKAGQEKADFVRVVSKFLEK